MGCSGLVGRAQPNYPAPPHVSSMPMPPARFDATHLAALRALAPAAADSAISALGAEEPTVAPWVLQALRQGLIVGAEQIVTLLEPDGAITEREVYLGAGRMFRLADGDPGHGLELMRRSTALFFRAAVELAPQAGVDAGVLVAAGLRQPELMEHASTLFSAGFDEQDRTLRHEAHAARARLHALAVTAAEPPLQERLEAAATDAGWPLPEKVLVAVAHAPEVSTSDPAPAPSRVLVGVLDDTIVLLLPADEDADSWIERTRKALGIRGPIVRGPTVPVAEAQRSYARALSALERLCEVTDDTVLRADEHLLDLVLSADPELATRFAGRMLAPLEALDEATYDRMLVTLKAWLDRPDRPQAIADSIFVHVQTVRYRLRQLRELFGEQLDDPERRTELAIAVRIAQRHGRPQAQPAVSPSR